MLESKTRWKLKRVDDQEIAEKLAKELNIQSLVAKLLIVRGIDTVEAASAFINGGVEGFHEPYLLDGMEAAVYRIRKALAEGERIRIYGDYDADGVNSTALLIRLFEQLGASFDYYIPHRTLEGYGLNVPALDKAKDAGVSLLVTVDTGISAVEHIEYAKQLGIDVIVTDHHEPPEVLPDAFAVINPKKPGCTYPFKHLAGVGVALKLAEALLEEIPLNLLPFAAIGTVADLMPLVGENRLIVKLGIQQLQQAAPPGIEALLKYSRVEQASFNATHIGFALAPRINASGRLAHAEHAVQLLTTKNEQEADQLASELDQLNKERQRIVDDLIKLAREQLEVQMSKTHKGVTLVAGENWNAGVIGIVASKLMDICYRPTFVFSIDAETGLAKGSARSIPGFDVYEALKECSEWLEHYGGHQAAAGMTLKAEHLPRLQTKLNDLTKRWLSEEDYIPAADADIECELEDISINTIEQLELLSPFGMGNPNPTFWVKQAKLQDIRTIGSDGKHLKLQLSSDRGLTKPVEAIGFGFGSLFHHISPQAHIDILGELQMNEWNGYRKPQILIEDISVRHTQVFDYRGKPAQTFIDTVLKDQVEEQIGIVCFNEEDFSFAAKRFETYHCSVWYIHEKDESLCEAKQSDEQGFTQLNELVLWSMPKKREQIVKALRLAHEAKRIYVLFQQSASQTFSMLPDRNAFKLCYGILQTKLSWKLGDPKTIAYLSKRTGLSPAIIQFIFEVFEELSFIRKQDEQYIVEPTPVKRDLQSSNRYQQQMLAQEMEHLFILSTHADLQAWILEHMVSKQTEHEGLRIIS